MFGLIKKFFKDLFTKEPAIVVELYNEDLCSELTDLSYSEGLEECFSDPVNKMYILNTYSNSLDDLASSLNTPRLNKGVIAIDMISYMGRNVSGLNYTLRRLVSVLEKGKISKVSERDLYEFINMCKYFLENR